MRTWCCLSYLPPLAGSANNPKIPFATVLPRQWQRCWSPVRLSCHSWGGTLRFRKHSWKNESWCLSKFSSGPADSLSVPDGGTSFARDYFFSSFFLFHTAFPRPSQLHLKEQVFLSVYAKKKQQQKTKPLSLRCESPTCRQTATRSLVRSGSTWQPNKSPPSVGWWIASFPLFHSSQGFFGFSLDSDACLTLKIYTQAKKKNLPCKSKKQASNLGGCLLNPALMWRFHYKSGEKRPSTSCKLHTGVSAVRSGEEEEKKRGPRGPQGFFGWSRL